MGDGNLFAWRLGQIGTATGIIEMPGDSGYSGGCRCHTEYGQLAEAVKVFMDDCNRLDRRIHNIGAELTRAKVWYKEVKVIVKIGAMVRGCPAQSYGQIV